VRGSLRRRFLRFFLEHVDEFRADELAFLFRVGDARKPAMKRASASTTTSGML
jgi:hypothetical protein